MIHQSEGRAVAGDAGARVGGSAATRSEAFQRLADQHLDAAYRLARAIVRDPAEAEDATHDAFVQAWRKFETLRDPSRFQHWFDRILVNICRNRLRRGSRWHRTDLKPEIAVTASDSMTGFDDHEILGDAIARLSADHQVVLALRYFRDLTVDEIARRLSVRPGTVKSRLHHALRRLEREVAHLQEMDR